MKPFIEHARVYANAHQTPVTFYTHLIGIPLVILSLMIFLSFFHLLLPGIFNLTLALIATVIVLVYYFLLNWRLASVLTPIFFILLLLAHLFTLGGLSSLAVWTFIITLVLGVSALLIGHYLERKQPAFMNSLSQIIVAPLCLIAKFLFRLGYMKTLEAKIHEEGSLNPDVRIDREKT